MLSLCSKYYLNNHNIFCFELRDADICFSFITEIPFSDILFVLKTRHRFFAVARNSSAAATCCFLFFFHVRGHSRNQGRYVPAAAAVQQALAKAASGVVQHFPDITISDD